MANLEDENEVFIKHLIKTFVNDKNNIREFKYVIKNNYAIIIDVYDGDTVTAVSFLEGHDDKLFKVKFRLDKIDTPEMRSRNPTEREYAIKAKEYLSNMVLNKLVYCEVNETAKDQYGRLLTTLYVVDRDGKHPEKSVNQLMIDNGHARHYSGGHKEEWVFNK